MLSLLACRIGLTGVKNVVALLGLLPPPPPPLPFPPPGLSGLARLSIEVVPNVVFLSPLQLPLPPDSTPCACPVPLTSEPPASPPSEHAVVWVRFSTV